VKEAIVSKLDNVKDCVHTLTSDNGKEFAYHRDIAFQLEASMYFARPYHSWERGLNEHTNGLVRQYLPKHERLDTVTQERVDEIENLLNNRPRKVLQFRTPLEVFNQRRAEVAAGETTLTGEQLANYQMALNSDGEVELRQPP